MEVLCVPPFKAIGLFSVVFTTSRYIAVCKAKCVVYFFCTSPHSISTDKQEIIDILRNQYNTYKARKESIAKCDEEMAKCQSLLEKLDIPKEINNVEDPRIKELQDEVNELKNIIKQASSMVPPPMKQMLPQDMQNVMNEVNQ